MKRITINSTRRHGRNSRSKFTSAVLCTAAVAIALCAAVVRMRKDNRGLVDNTSSENTSSSTVSSQAQSTTSSHTAGQTKASSAPSAPNNSKQPAANPANTTPDASADEYEFFEDSEQTLAIQTATVPGNYVRAVGGAITKDFNMTGLVYSRTMGDWRVHNGLDISANKGEIVKSVAEGTVAGISADPMYGTTVTVNQNDGLMVYYRGLSSDTAVSVGDKISAGTTIGTIGEIPCESGDGTHLHLEIKRDNKFLNPAETFGYR